MMVVTEGSSPIFLASLRVVERCSPFFAVTVYIGVPSLAYQWFDSDGLAAIMLPSLLFAIFLSAREGAVLCLQ
jgi:hypothetical protein